MTDPGSNQYRFVYTLDGQVDSLLLGTGVKEDRNYDADGRLTSRNRISSDPSLGGLVSGTLSYDRMNRVIHSVENSHGQIAEDTHVAYDGLGAVMMNEQSSGFGTNVEEFRNDAFGNVLYRKTQRTAGTNDAPFVLQYNPQGMLRIASAVPSNPPGQNQLNDDLAQTFAGGGQLIRQSQLVQDDQTVSLEVAARHYYSADDKLMTVQRYSYRPSLRDGTWEEYWYDALGRRVLTRARRDPNSIYDAMISGPLCLDQSSPRCRSFTERVWWDGDQALVEQRSPEGASDVSNSGTIGNIHGLTLDEPLAVIADQTRIVNYNWRGQGESSVFPNGAAGDASLGNNATEIDWPALTQAQTYFTPGPGSGGSGNPKRWMGTFVANGQGTTGMLYRRNRYFNPTSGQFTQADPIGIAGGMNVFGFAGGDPVNFGDPLGLDCRVISSGEKCPESHPFREWFAGFACGIGDSCPTAESEPNTFAYRNGRAFGLWGGVLSGRFLSDLDPEFPTDHPDGNTKNWSARMNSEGDARNLARTKLGANPVKVGPNKWRSQDGRWQYRSMPSDVRDRHIHLEELDPQTGRVIQNVHLRW